jgi:AcrR family transcriptional regulator
VTTICHYGRVNSALAEPRDRQAELAAAAGRVLRRVGFERMRLLDVAREAGVSIGLLQHYFETREQLGREAFAAACGERAREFSDSVAATGTAWERIEEMLRHAFDPRRLRDRAGTWLELCAAASRDEALRAEAAGVQAIWREPIEAAIAAGAAAGELDPALSPAAAADLMLALIDGAEVAVTLGESTERLLAAATTVLRDALGAPVEKGTR